MAVPAHLNTTVNPYAYHQSSAIVDVETGGVGIITNLRTYLVTDRGYTEPSTALFVSPVDPGGKSYDLLVTRISATVLELRTRDHLAHTICTRRIQIDAGGTAINYWTSKFFARVESLRATPEAFNADLLQCSPDDDSGHQFTLVSTGYRDNASTADGQYAASSYFMWDESSAAATFRDRGAWAPYDLAGTQIGRANTATASGSHMCEDVVVGTVVAAIVTGCAGRLWHAYRVPSALAFGTDKTLPVDDNVTATFRVVGYTTNIVDRIAFRKSDP